MCNDAINKARAGMSYAVHCNIKDAMQFFISLSELGGTPHVCAHVDVDSKSMMIWWCQRSEPEVRSQHSTALLSPESMA
eukprot:scaffold95597_cov64-Cyclotella_meneghiniana.AAC.1